jgi:hypothetical protein
LINVNFPKTTILKDFAFYGCTSLSNVVFPEVVSIGEYYGGTFADCTNLTSASFPKLASIKDGGGGGDMFFPGAFRGCTSLTNLNIPAITSIDGSTFYSTGTTSLTITMGNAAPTVTSTSERFHNVSAKTVTIKVPSGAKSGTNYDTTWETSFTGGNSNITVVWDTY